MWIFGCGSVLLLISFFRVLMMIVIFVLLFELSSVVLLLLIRLWLRWLRSLGFCLGLSVMEGLLGSLM